MKIKRKHKPYARGLAILLMLIAILVETGIFSGTGLVPYTFWIAVTSFSLLLLSTT
ncbi:hypothetical protein AB9P05_14025 [Roseivirga sp. BDSF3-8]|uniref:hypothetical protein n=1 Tax=Roseivirga sp. BDSF3-8 TaxID=3241598 RepID=UPI0035327C48